MLLFKSAPLHIR